MRNKGRAYDRPEDAFAPEELKRDADIRVRGITHQLKKIQSMENGIPSMTKQVADKLAIPSEVMNDAVANFTLSKIDPDLIANLNTTDRSQRASILAHMWQSIERDKENVTNLLSIAQDQFAMFGSDPQALLVAHLSYAKYADLISSFDRELVKLTKIIMEVRAQWDLMDAASTVSDDSYESFADRAAEVKAENNSLDMSDIDGDVDGNDEE